MPKYRIGGSYGYVGTGWEDEIEADSIEDAEEIAWECAIAQVEHWAEEIEEEE